MRTYKFLFSALLALILMGASANAKQSATAKVVDVVGTVTKFLADGSKESLKVGDLIREGDAISATALSSASLVFSNGSEVTIQENTSVNFTTMQQEAFVGGQTYEALQADPSPSQTILDLNYGELTGHVKKLRQDSRFEINTPLGAAAIRGTRFTVMLIYNAERSEFRLLVKNLDGLVDIISRYVGSVEYGSGNVGDKGYESSLTEDVREVIPANHIVVIRLQRTDPLFDDLIRLLINFIPTGPRPTITPGPGPGPDPEDDDKGVIVVSPEGRG